MLRFLPLVALCMSTTVMAQVSEFMLGNGMKVIVKEDHRAPIAVTQVWYKVGASYEQEGITGISHLLEHMMFKGTKKLKPNEFSQIIARNGGRENAFTGTDYTAYFQTLSSDKLDIAFELEADRMANIQFEKSEFIKELEVVKEERRWRTEDKPTAKTAEQFRAVAYRSSPYRIPIVGWMHDLDNMKVEDALNWYKKWYTPSNATLVVAGDVDPHQIHEMAKQTFGLIESVPVPTLKPAIESPSKGVTEVTVETVAKQPYLLMGYKTPNITGADDEEAYALEVLAGVLDGGDSARFANELVRKQKIAASASASYSAFTRLPGMFMLSAIPARDKTMSEVQAALEKQVGIVQQSLVDDKELKRVQAQVIADHVYEQDSVFYQAMEIGMLETIGLDWTIANQYIENIKAVTAEQVRAVANKYLRKDNLTIGRLKPLVEKKQG